MGENGSLRSSIADRWCMGRERFDFARVSLVTNVIDHLRRLLGKLTVRTPHVSQPTGYATIQEKMLKSQLQPWTVKRPIAFHVRIVWVSRAGDTRGSQLPCPHGEFRVEFHTNITRTLFMSKVKIQPTLNDIAISQIHYRICTIKIAQSIG